MIVTARRRVLIKLPCSIPDAGHDAQLVEFDDVTERIPLDPVAQAQSACIRLCLPVSRADEVAAAVQAADAGMPRRLAAIRWDVRD